VRYLGDFQFGQFTPPVGLQMITSSWDIGFMEPASALQAIAPSSQPGVQAANTNDDRRGTWTLGAYAGLGSGPGSEYGSDSQSFGNLMGRVTWLAVDMTDDKKPTANRYLHLGVSTNLQRAANGQIRYRSRPESYLAPYIIDTGNIDASSARTIGLEALWVGGPLSAQAELIASRVGSDLNGSLNFAGLYAQASWYLTGESRPYNRSDGTPGRLIPLRNFGFGSDKSWGALEVAARVSYTDLSSGTVQGGRLTMLVGSLNWYLRPQLKCMFELGTGRVDDAVGTGNGNGNFVMGQLRLGAYFY
jgi:phosphate-selective porin OprO/OprP